MVAASGVEPPTFRVWTGRSNQLSYTAIGDKFIYVATKILPLRSIGVKDFCINYNDNIDKLCQAQMKMAPKNDKHEFIKTLKK